MSIPCRTQDPSVGSGRADLCQFRVILNIVLWSNDLITWNSAFQTALYVSPTENDQERCRMRAKTKIITVGFAAVCIIGTAGPGVAMAAQHRAVPDTNGVLLCDTDIPGIVQCAQFDPTYVVGEVVEANQGFTRLDVPTSKGQISDNLASPHLCFSEHGGSAIKLATCAGASAEEWTPHSHAGKTYYVNAANGLCINDDYPEGYLNTATCNEGTDELFSPSA
jgi:hypothetical protein